MKKELLRKAEHQEVLGEVQVNSNVVMPEQDDMIFLDEISIDYAKEYRQKKRKEKIREILHNLKINSDSVRVVFEEHGVKEVIKRLNRVLKQKNFQVKLNYHDWEDIIKEFYKIS